MVVAAIPAASNDTTPLVKVTVVNGVSAMVSTYALPAGP